MLPLRPISQLRNPALILLVLRLPLAQYFFRAGQKKLYLKLTSTQPRWVAFSFIHTTIKHEYVEGNYGPILLLSCLQKRIYSIHIQIYMASPCSSFVRSSPSLVLMLLMHNSGCKNLERKRGRGARRVCTKLPDWTDVQAQNYCIL